MNAPIVFEKRLTQPEIVEVLRNITFRGVYDKDGNPLKPYKDATFSLVKVYPPEEATSFPKLIHNMQKEPLFTAQPTIYKTQTDMLHQVDSFLETIGKRIHTLEFEGIQYTWEGRGRYHVLPPIVEKHSYPLINGYFDLQKISAQFDGAYVKDGRGNLHHLAEGVIRDFYIDKESKISYMNPFNSNAELINYGLRFNGPTNFFVICDGSHRMDYAVEILNEPINVILVEGASFPYYAFPIPFRPMTRLTSKQAERKYPKLERDKIHLLNDHIRKVLHYDWEAGGLHVSKLRSARKFF